MVFVYMLIKTTAGRMWNACTFIEGVRGVKSVHVVTGSYDIIAYFEIPSTRNIEQLADGIRGISSVVSTQTCVAS